LWYDRKRICLLRQKAPQPRMVPAEFMAATVAMFTYARSQLLEFADKLLTPHPFEVFIHGDHPPPRASQEISGVMLHRSPSTELPAGFCIDTPCSSRHPSWDSAHLSTTRSACASTDCRIVSPRVFAVFRLTSSSNSVGCSTGGFAGLAPLKILST